MHIPLFDLPVYRLTSARYAADQQRAREKTRAHYEALCPAGGKISTALDQRISDQQMDKYGPWEFNEILGYIRLHFLGSQVRGEYFSAEKQRNPISRTKVFKWQTWKLAPERSFNPKASNDEILRVIRQYVADCRALLPKRFIDDSAIETLGPHVDWRSLRQSHVLPTTDDEEQDFVRP